MFCCKRNPDKKIEAMASILILGGVVPLAVAIVAQHLFQLAPCHFCILQRWPYGVAIIAGVASLLVPRLGLWWRFFVAAGILAFLATGLLGLVHTGIETGFLHYAGSCVAQAPAEDSLDALKQSIMAAPIVSCNEVRASFLGLSMASWNSLFALVMLILTFLQYRFEYRRRYGR